MFNGILSDVIGRNGHVGETGNGNRNNNDDDDNGGGGGGGDSCAERFSDRWTQDVASMVGVFEGHVTRYHNHVLRTSDSVATTSSSTDTLQPASCRHCVQEVGTSNIEAPTSVSCSAELFVF